jgi:tetratricopeptide (TPR) repeat protein
MSQQPPQWSPQAVQIFTAARQISDQGAQNTFVTQACEANAQLRWEVDWLLQWDRSQQQGVPTATAHFTSPVAVAQPSSLNPASTATLAQPRRSWRWPIAIAVMLLLFVGLFGIFGYGAYRGITHLRFESQVTTQESLASSSFYDGDYEEAARAYEKLAELRKKQYGDEHAKVAEMLGKAASAWYYDRAYERAADLYQQAYKIDVKQLGPKHETTLEHHSYWGICLREGQHSAQALKIFNDVLAKRKESLGPSHEKTAEAYILVAQTYAEMGVMTECIANYVPAYESYKKKYSPYHQDAINTMDAIVHAYDAIGRYDDSRKLLQTVYDGQKNARGLDDGETAKVRTWVCERLQREADWPALIKVRQEVVDDRQSRIGAEDPRTIAAKEDLADAYIRQGDFTKGIELLENCREKRLKVQGPDGPELMNCLDSLADAYNKAKTPDKGIALFQHVWEERKARLGPRSTATLQSAVHIGWRRILAGKGSAEQIAAGETEMEAALNEAIKTVGIQDEAVNESTVSLAEHFRRTRQFAKEVEWRRKLAQHFQANGGIEDKSTRRALENLADAEIEAGNHQAAIDIYRRLHDSEVNRGGASGVGAAFHARSLILAYLQANQPAKALEYCDETMTQLSRRGDRPYFWTSWTAADVAEMFARAENPVKSCEAFLFAISHRENEMYSGDEYYERMLLLWPKQAAVAKDTDKARTALKAKLEETTREIGPSFYLSQSARMLLGLHAQAVGDLAEAEKYFREIETLARGQSIAWHSESLGLLAGVLRRQEKHTEAEKAIREAIELKTKMGRQAVNPRSWQRITTVSDAQLELADCLIAQDKFSDAETLLLAIREEKAKLDFLEEDFWDVRCRVGALQRLIAVQTKLGKPAEDVARWTEEIDSLEKIYTGVTKV